MANRIRHWLETQVETAVQMSKEPPKIAVWDVVLELPADILQGLFASGHIYGFAGFFWFDYEQNGRTVCVPIKTGHE